MSADTFLDDVADRLAALPGVVGVALGGSRAQGTAGPDSDWDLAIHYRGDFDVTALRDVGWPGEVSELGGWGGGVFNGGAWLTIDGRKVDVHYRDLDVVEREVGRARRGEFDVEPLMFHLAGIPTYLVVAELALGRALRGALPRVVDYPEALRRSAPPRWAGMGDLTLSYAEHAHARRGRTAQCLGLIAVATSQYAHAVLAARGEWVTNDKHLLTAAGLDGVHTVMSEATDEPGSLVRVVERTRSVVGGALRVASGE